MELGARSDLEHMLVDETADPKPLPLSLLEDITCRFSPDQQIGRGGFAVVYKGILGNGTVAVKRLLDPFMDESKFIREIECLMRVKHKNVVRFLGYCVDRQGNANMYDGKFVMADVHNRLLCFEYLPKGSLEKYIIDTHLEWAMCYKIIKGICEGIQYLHDKNIVHLDLKPANILLDNEMSPKICDFGLSRCFKENQRQQITNTREGTLGYIAPEFLIGGVITWSADLYSLGVVIIKILTGHKLIPPTEEVLRSWSDRLERSQRDKLLKQIQVCYEIALECINNNPKKRPDHAQSIIYRLCIQENGVEQLLYDAKELRIKVCAGALASLNMDVIELMKISDVSHITLSDLQKLNSLRSLHFKSCNNTVFAELDDTDVLHSVQNLYLEELPISGEVFTKVLRCFPALSQLTIKECKSLELLPVEDGGLSNLKMLQSFTGYNCKNLFSRWVMGEEGGRARAIKPFPTSLRELEIFVYLSIQSMGLLSNLTSLTSLRLKACTRLTMDGFNPLITVKLKKLTIDVMSTDEECICIAQGLLSGIGRSGLLHAGSFQLEQFRADSTSAVLTTPICSHLAATLHTLELSHDEQMTAFTKQQQQALQLLTSLRYLEFRYCLNLQSLPQGLYRLSSLKRLQIYGCEKIMSLPFKEGLPTSLKKLDVWYCSPELTEQAEKLKGDDPWFSVEIRVSDEDVSTSSKKKDVSMSRRMWRWIRG